ncbi:MAG TPA: hypothetical protein VGS58_04715 [Candidatus Sulfopaludibacter sp.]|nr:hypothetical protein [Candidatus Sulfopaludibacter sp.]
MRRAYRLILRLFPFDYRLWFAAEILAAFDRAHREGGTARELAALAAALPAEWIAKLSTDPAVRGRALPDVRMMRPVGIPQHVWFRRPCSSDTSR